MVLDEFCRLFPQADIYTLVHEKGSVSPLIESHRIIESPVVKLPRGRKHYRTYLPLFPWAIEAFDLRGYDLVLSDSHCVAKGAIPAPDALTLSYVHTPMRYVWDVRTDYLGPDQYGSLKRLIAGFAAHYLRAWDAVSATRIDAFAANSRHVASRVRKYYRRDATVIYPPVELDKFKIGTGEGGYYVTASALVPYKRVDLAVKACTELGLRLKVLGDGPEYRKLKHVAGPTVEFAGHLSRDELVEVYRDAVAFIHPGEEDFGIAPVEAQACGRPVIGFGRGGLTETVITGGETATGIFFYEQSVAALREILRSFDPTGFKPEEARRNAARFDAGQFSSNVVRFIEHSRRIVQESRGE